MKKLSKASIVQLISLLVTLLLLAKLIALISWYILPDKGVELSKNRSSAMEYHRVDFSSMIGKRGSTQITKSSKSSIESDITELILTGLYGTKKSGFAIVAKKSSPKKTAVIAVGESFAGYKLKEIYLNYVIFQKGQKEYILKLDTKIVPQIESVVEPYVDENKKSISRRDIDHYAKNFREIWRDISIVPLKKGGKIEGFKVTKIKPGSKMAELGLVKGDVIIKANNVKLSSFNDAIKIYRNINKIDTIELVILRDNQEKEIVYEIH